MWVACNGLGMWAIGTGKDWSGYGWGDWGCRGGGVECVRLGISPTRRADFR